MVHVSICGFEHHPQVFVGNDKPPLVGSCLIMFNYTYNHLLVRIGYKWDYTYIYIYRYIQTKPIKPVAGESIPEPSLHPEPATEYLGAGSDVRCVIC